MKKLIFIPIFVFSFALAQEIPQDSAQDSKEVKNSILILHTNNQLLNSTQVDYIDILGKDALLNSSDVAKSLLQVPGFSVAKKGGGGAESFYRSQGGGRLPIIVNSGFLQGGCGGRMDTPLTYIFAQNYNSIKIIKGPQDVRYAPIVAGSVLFEREPLRFKENTFNGGIDALYGSFGRFDFNTHLSGGNAFANLQAIYSDYQSNDYKDGNGNRVHSQYHRRSGSFIGTLTPDSTTTLEFSIDLGEGEAAYADRALDGSAFDRESYQAHLQKILSNNDIMDLYLYQHRIDHVMDNYSLSGIPKSGNTFSLSNPSRQTTGGKIEYTKSLNLAKFYFGGNYYEDAHKARSKSGTATKAEAQSTLNLARIPNFTFKNMGIYTQGEWYPTLDSGIFAGIRGDRVQTQAHRQNRTNTDYAFSGFGRYEAYLQNFTLYAGVGYAQRIPDFWEVGKTNGMDLNKEQNTQLDIGANYQKNALSINLSSFASYVKDYILLDYTSTPTRSFNTNAILLGTEAEVLYEFLPNFFASGTLSYTYGENTKENKALAQIAPLEARFALKYDNNKAFIKGEVYANAKQTRSDKGYGNVVGADLGKSSGFGIFNLYAGYRYKDLQLLAGIENITDKVYSYHLSKNSIGLNVDNPVSTRIYEMGRNLWIRAKLEF